MKLIPNEEGQVWQGVVGPITADVLAEVKEDVLRELMEA